MSTPYTVVRRVRIKDAGRYWGDGHHGTDNRATYDAVIEISVDFDAIERSLGRKAVLNKSKRSRLGPITVKAHSVEEVTP